MNKKGIYRYAVWLSYKGTNYHGWQIQPNGITIQEVLNDRFSKLLRQEIMFNGAGRTDTGVHASYFIAHFDVLQPIDDTYKLVWKANSFLPKDISIQKIHIVTSDFNSRFDAQSRTYKYFIHNQKNPFFTDTSWYCRYKLDVNKMQEGADALFDYDDFTSFSKLHTDVKTNICQVMLAKWMWENNQLVFTIKANRFLRNMVRAITGTLIELGRGKISLDDFRKIIEKKDRSKAGTSAPALGLFLTDIEYPENLLSF